MVRMLNFFTALSLTPSDIQKIRYLVTTHKVNINVLDNILVTPLFISPHSLNQIKELKEAGAKITFDSGGYYVQVGRITYQELYYPLLQFYRSNSWGDTFTLPDFVPTSQDHPDVVEQKVRDTAKYSGLFFDELPDELKPRAMGVVQGHTLAQVDLCLKTYLEKGIKKIGFGSFGTVGKNSQTNIATDNAVNLAQYVVNISKQYEATVHLFGVGVPALVAMISGVGADSFDSSTWLKSAGFGQIFLPFTRSYNISHRNGSAEMHKGITVDAFLKLRDLTEHNCPFCASIEELQKKKLYRASHNLICIKETVEAINNRKTDLIRKIYSNGSPKYQQEYEKWLVHA